LLLFAKYLEARPDCQKGETIVLHRRLTKTEKMQTVQTIQTAPAFIALMTFDLGGIGHNFQQADHILFTDRHWNPQVRTNKAYL